MFGNWYGRKRKAAEDHPEFPATLVDDGDAAQVSQYRHRSEVVRTAFAEVLALTGIPPGWLSLVAQRAHLPDGGHGIHARLILRHWDARLFQGAPQFERLLLLRVQALDASHRQWLQATSWSFALPEDQEAALPPLPAASAWLPRSRSRRDEAWQKTMTIEARTNA